MQRSTLRLLLPLSLLVASGAAAQPRGDRGFRDGANHHLGDDGFVQKFGRQPLPADGEKIRMKMHFEYVRNQLAARPPTRPELAARRQELLGYLGEYMAKGITPKNHHLGERTPVFIDDDNQICAVGYLIERSIGRALPEKIKRVHRFDFIEDIAAAMPEVRAWVDSSGLSLDEIASIQPGYTGPEIDQWQRWALREMKNGPYEADESSYHVTGQFRLQQMHGEWKKTTEDGKLIGSGTFAMGSGAWRSNYKSGGRLAEGRFANSHPTGTWRFYHPSGNLAAEGQLEGHARRGVWRFYYDMPAKTLFAKGTFSSQTGWEYYDDAGKLLASASSAAPKSWGKDAWGRLTAITTGADDVRRAVYSGSFPHGTIGDDLDGDGQPDPRYVSTRLEGLALGDEHMVFASASGLDEEYSDDPVIYDGDGRAIAKTDEGTWQARECTWSAARKAAARAGDLVRLDGLLFSGTANANKEDCGAATPVDEARAKRYDALLAVHDGIRSRTPDFVDHIRDNELDEPAERTADEAEEEGQDLVRTISLNRQWDHLDTRFIQVFRSIPGSRFNF
ncbi:MAG TPA: hypothetical protein VN253_20870 [Kofleriaceae bacterium]|nr:hypothetical protein [Kofleriaceae bacterium]